MKESKFATKSDLPGCVSLRDLPVFLCLSSSSGITPRNIRYCLICIGAMLRYHVAVIGRLERRIHWKHWAILAKYGMGSDEARAANRLLRAASPSEATLERLEEIWVDGVPLEGDSAAARG